MSIIGINGRIGVGKDLVGKIIQYLTLENKQGPYIGFETYDYATLERNSKFKVKKFAGKLKTIASLLTGIPVEKFEDQEFKKSYLGAEWGTVESNPLNAVPVFENIEFNHLMSIREFLQKLGTEAMRDGLHTNVWVNALMCDYRGPKLSEYNPSNWIITDVRFPNELEAIVERKGITIRVHRDIHDGKARISKNPHVSETAIDNAKFDYEIINDGSIEDLIEKVRIILITEKII